MKTRINFVDTSSRPIVTLVNLNFVLFMALLSLLLIIGAYVSYSVKLNNTEASVKALTKQASEQRALIEQMTEALASRVQSPKLLAQIQTQQQSLTMKQVVLDELDSRETQKNNGFSQLMVDLATHHQRNLWLTSVMLDERNIALQGTANDSTAVPKWIDKLSSASYFAGREFAGARMLRDENKQIDFVLSSQLDDVAGEGQ